MREEPDPERFVSLQTFRSSGEPVATPVWFANDGAAGFVFGTHRDSGKVRRIRSIPAVRFAPANFRGLERGPYAAGVAEILEPADAERAELALEAKYGWEWDAFGRKIDCFVRVRPR